MAAHSFKFASLIGRTLTELATGQAPSTDLEPFRIDRAVLTMPEPPRSWMPGVPFEGDGTAPSGETTTA